MVVAVLGEGVAKLAGGNLTWRLNQPFPAEYRKLRDDFSAAIARLQDAAGSAATAAALSRDPASRSQDGVKHVAPMESYRGSRGER